ncbi:MAG: ABC transporter substrate-binding protein [Gammaproteobacteria bacterium]|nr:ABC transporter substrate-binding protein [Gammaproteobacteria bacterium]
MIFERSWRHKIIPLLFALLLASGPCAGAEEPLRFGFLCPRPPEQAFWSQVITVMQAAAEDLGVELKIICDASGSPLNRRRIGDELLNSEPKLDYFLTGYWTTITKHHMALAKQRGIKVFIFNADIDDSEAEEMGEPRGKYDNWIGHMVPDDQAGAMELTEILVNRAGNIKKRTAPRSVNVYGIFGAGKSTVTRRRKEGFREQAELMPIAKLHEIVINRKKRMTASAKVNAARKWTLRLMSDSSDVDVIGTGSQDEMWGVLQGVEQADKIAGQDVLIGGFDWNQETMDAIAEGRISASMFGHFMEGAWVLLLAHDYHYGFDFADDVGINISTPFGIIVAGNYVQYKAILNKAYWRSVDFKQLSKKYNEKLKSYNLNISQFIDKEKTRLK